MKRTVTLSLELQPFCVPTFVRTVPKVATRGDAFADVPAFPLSDVDSDMLDHMCEDFRVSVFKKANKPLPERKL